MKGELDNKPDLAAQEAETLRRNEWYENHREILRTWKRLEQEQMAKEVN